MTAIEDLDSVMEQRASRDISPKDEMYLFARTQIPTDEMTRWYYFQTGKEVALGVVKHLLGAELDPSTLDLLDYAAGYGRVTRWLAPVLRSVTVADLEPGMIDFHKSTFGVDGFVTPADPKKRLSPQHRDFDVVFVFSLFTHLPKSTWAKWLSSIANTVRPGGFLIFSVHSYELFAELNPARFGDPKTWTKDFLFWEDNETNGRLNTAAYGCTIVKDSYVRGAVARMRGFEVAHHYKKGEFDRYHDIYAVRRR